MGDVETSRQKEAVDPGGQRGDGADAAAVGRVGSDVQGHVQNSMEMTCS